jgi:hypothetical protein
MTLDLHPDADTLFARFKPKWRYNVRLAERRGVEVAEAGADELPTFFALLVETARRDRFAVRGARYFERAGAARMLRMWLARYAGRVIAGAVLRVRRAGDLHVRRLRQRASRRDAESPRAVDDDPVGEGGRGGIRLPGSAMGDGKPVEPANVGLNRFKGRFRRALRRVRRRPELPPGR